MWKATVSTENLMLENVRISMSFTTCLRLNSDNPEFILHMYIKGIVKLLYLTDKSS